MGKALLGIDTGGTFTDFVLLRGDALRVHKVLSRPDAPQEAILQGITDMGLAADVEAGEIAVIHGTTVATNAVLEGKGVRTAYVTNRGLKDVLAIGRQTREALYDLTPKPRQLPFIDELMLEVDCRLAADGSEILPLTDEALDRLVERIEQLAPEAVAINLLFSFLDSGQEARIQAALPGDIFVSRSSEILPEYREFERGITTWINAWIGPLIEGYLGELARRLAPAHVSIMQSSGLTISADQASRRAVNLLLSGPAGGLSGSMHIGERLGRKQLMTFDMGGTSTDVALLDGEIRLTSAGRIATFPIGVPMADIHTIGAGGGSIAWIDDGGLLQVGPASAGASPGPACYGKGGTEPTVTDANLVLGRLRADAFLGGEMTLDESASRQALEPLAERLGLGIEELAQGIVTLANEHMTQALRVISIQRGFDPRDFTLTCFGGAGGLHFCDLAENLEMTECIVPVNSGVLSALGMLTASPGREMIRTHAALLSAISERELATLFDDLEAAGRAELEQEGVGVRQAQRSLDIRYAGQTFTINVPFTSHDEAAGQFAQEHERLYGHRLDKEAEMVNVRVHLEGQRQEIRLPPPVAEEASPPGEARVTGFDAPVSVVDRRRLASGTRVDGPMIVTEPHSTTLVKPGWAGEVDEAGNLLLRRKAT